jgi:hypothetical protein
LEVLKYVMDGGVIPSLEYQFREYSFGYWTKIWYYQGRRIYEESYDDYYGECVTDYTLNRVYVHRPPLAEENENVVLYPYPYIFSTNPENPDLPEEEEEL